MIEKDIKDIEKESLSLKDEEVIIKSTNKAKNIRREITSWIVIAIVAYVLAKFITTCIIIKAEIPSNSMETTIMTGDRLIGNRLAYLFSSPKRGDIVIFKFPDDETEDYIKRIIGLPGETIEIKNESVYIYDKNGTLIEGPFEEPYIKETMNTYNELSFTIPEDSYFVMGDNRNSSDDARYWMNPYVHKDKIVGKAVFRYKPSLGWIK